MVTACYSSVWITLILECRIYHTPGHGQLSFLNRSEVASSRTTVVLVLHYFPSRLSLGHRTAPFIAAMRPR